MCPALLTAMADKTALLTVPGSSEACRVTLQKPLTQWLRLRVARPDTTPQTLNYFNAVAILTFSEVKQWTKMCICPLNMQK